jgi:hypothetical protein
VFFLFRGLDILEAVRAFNNTIGTVGLVVGKIFAEERDFAVLTVRDLELALLKENERNGECEI